MHETCDLCVCGVSILSVLVHGTVSAELLVRCQVSISISLHRGWQDQMAFSHANHKPSRMCMSGTCPLCLCQPSSPMVGPFTTISSKQDHFFASLCVFSCLGIRRPESFVGLRQLSVVANKNKQSGATHKRANWPFCESRYLSDAALSGLADALDGAGLAFEAMSHAWMEELESGHQRGTKWPRWLVERQHGVLNLARDLLQTQVETKTGGHLPAIFHLQ